jgi:hypothetical protein
MFSFRDGLHEGKCRNFCGLVTYVLSTGIDMIKKHDGCVNLVDLTIKSSVNGK